MIDNATDCLIESAQDITLYAYDRVYQKEGYESSREVLELFRRWAEEFESKWDSNANLDYMEEIDKFAEKKLQELGL